MTRRTQALAAAAALPAGERIPDALLFAEGLDPTDTFIGALVAAAPPHGYTCRKCGVWYAGPNGFHDCGERA